MSASAPSGFHHHVLAPKGREFLTCRFLCPDDFVAAELPELPADELKTSARFLPLGVVVAKYAPVFFSVGARPAFSDGTVSEWLTYIARSEGYDPGATEVVSIGSLQGVACDAIQIATDGSPMRMRLVLIESGDRLYNLSAMAPTQLWAAMAPNLERMIGSFELKDVQEQKAALTPEHGKPEIQPASAEEPAQENVADPASAGSGDPQVVNAGTEEARLTPAEWAEVVMASDTSSLDPEHRINANLRDRGVGLVPRVLDVDQEAKSARVGCGGIEGVIHLPFGWHVIDDGRRSLIFDAGGRMQISINRRRSNVTPAEMGRLLLDEIMQQQPGIHAFEGNCGGITVVGVRELKVDAETLDQAYFIREVNQPGVLLVARVTGNADDIRLAMNLAGDVLARIQLLDTVAAR